MYTVGVDPGTGPKSELFRRAEHYVQLRPQIGQCTVQRNYPHNGCMGDLELEVNTIIWWHQ